MIKLGLFVRDKVTGFEGVAENRATFLYGCDRYLVQPQVDKDGKIPSASMIDEPQLEIHRTKAPAMVPLREPTQLIKLGAEVYDPVRGMKGTATGRAVYLNGCSRIYVEPKRGKLLSQDIKPWWVDEQQLTTKKKVVHETRTADVRAGGPARSSSKY